MKNILTLLFALLISNLFSQDFTLLLGNNKENRSNKIEFYKDAYYVIGSVENRFGTISKLDLNGREIWTYKNSVDGSFNDFHITNDRLIVIGAVGANTASRSYIAVLNPNDGSRISSKEYDFSPNLREGLVRITSYTDPSGNLNIVATGIEIYVTSGLLYDRPVLYNLDNAGNLVKRTILKEDYDNEYVFPSFNPKNGDILWYGNQLAGGPNGVILKTDKAGNKIDGKVFTSSHYHSCHSSNYDGNAPTHILGGRLIGANSAIISKYEDTKLIYTYEFSGLTIFLSISKLSQPNTYRIIGSLNGTTIDPYIIDFVDEGSTLKILQSYSLKEISNSINSYSTTKLANGKNALCLSRPTSDGFGLSDGVISVFEGDALPKCYTAFPKIFNPTKINLQSTEFFIDTRSEGFTTSIDLLLNSEEYTSKLDCTCGGGGSVTTNLNLTACKGKNVTVNGQNYNTSGTYTQTLKTSAGCDSILNIKVDIIEPKESKIQASICQGQTYELNGQTYNSAGNYVQALKTTAGCDSIIRVNITVVNTKESKIEKTLCQGQSYELNGQLYNSAGTYIQTLKTTEGCDSLINLKINVLDNKETNLQATICQGQSYELNGQQYNSTGTYTQTLKTTAGCDSIINVKINVLAVNESNLQATICQGQSYVLNGNSYSTTGIYQQNLKTLNGCDSIVYLSLLVKNNSEELLNFSLCNGPVTINGKSYEQVGQYSQKLINSNGCDSTLVININECIQNIFYDLNACNAQNQLNTMTYTEFTPTYGSTLDCGKFSASNIYRENTSVNKHSCTSGVENSIAMCVSSMTSCTYIPGSSESIVFEVTLDPKSGEEMRLNNLSFYHQGPKTFNWINGSNGVNNYPTKFGVRVLKDGQEIFKQAEIKTDIAWTKFTESFNDLRFVATKKAVYRFELLPYCVVGANSQVTAWDIDNVALNIECGDGKARVISGNVVNYMVPTQLVKKHNGNIVATTMTNNDGGYTFSNVHSQTSYSLEAHNNDDPRLGLTTKDLIFIQRHLSGHLTLDNTQQVAADINANGKLSVSDLVELRKVLLGLKNNFSANESWLFVRPEADLDLINAQSKKSYSISPSFANLDQMNFKGIKIGDVDGSINFSNIDAQNRSSKSLITRINLEDNVTEQLKIYIGKEIEGLQLFIEVKNGQINSVESNLPGFRDNNFNLQNEFLNISWSSLNRTEEGYIVLNMSKGTSIVLKNESEVYQNDEVSRIIFENKGIATNKFSLWPNPTNGNAVINFGEIGFENFDFYLSNVNGNVIAKNEYQLSLNGRKLNLDLSNLPNGLYIYNLIIDGSSSNGKIIKID